MIFKVTDHRQTGRPSVSELTKYADRTTQLMDKVSKKKPAILMVGSPTA